LYPRDLSFSGVTPDPTVCRAQPIPREICIRLLCIPRNGVFFETNSEILLYLSLRIPKEHKTHFSHITETFPLPHGKQRYSDG
jgi:hypothetical protein